MSEALSVEAAVGLLASEDVSEPEAPLEAAEDQEIEAAPSAEEPAEDDLGAETEETEEAVAPLEAPRYWNHEAKAKFAALPPDLQAVVLEQEGPREAAAAKAKAEALEVRQSADREVQAVRQLAEQLATFLPQAVETFKSKWGDVDAPGYWKAVREAHGEEAERDFRDQYEAEQRHLAKLAQANAQAEAEARRLFVREETEKLKDIAPALADPEKGPERRTEVASYLLSQGIPKEALATISAAEMTISHKAMLWDRAQAAAKAKPKQPAAPAKAPVRPGAAPAQSSQQRSVTQVANRFAQKPTVDNAVELLLARKA